MLINRDELEAKGEANLGMHHAGYWSAVFQKALLVSNEETKPRTVDINSMNGAYYFEFTDPITHRKYAVRIKPMEERK